MYSPTAGLADIDAECEQFAVDAGARPKRGFSRLIFRISLRIPFDTAERSG